MGLPLSDDGVDVSFLSVEDRRMMRAAYDVLGRIEDPVRRRQAVRWIVGVTNRDLESMDLPPITA
jgi:hypothetical protein